MQEYGPQAALEISDDEYPENGQQTVPDISRNDSHALYSPHRNNGMAYEVQRSTRDDVTATSFGGMNDGDESLINMMINGGHK